MKLMCIAIAILIVMCGFIGIHSYIMNKMGVSLNAKNAQIKNLAMNDDWENARILLKEVSREWEKYSTWAVLTISTEDIEQLEISLEQAKSFAALETKSDFLGEFIMFSMLVDHIPHREGFHIEEIL